MRVGAFIIPFHVLNHTVIWLFMPALFRDTIEALSEALILRYRLFVVSDHPFAIDHVIANSPVLGMKIFIASDVVAVSSLPAPLIMA